MQEQTRRLYLEAMGITVWERRDTSMPAPVKPRDSQSATGTTEPNQAPSLSEEVPGLVGMPSWDEPPLDDLVPLDRAVDEPVWEPETPAARPSSVATLGWEALRERVRDCRACALREGCTQTVFGVGNPEAELMVIGEAPGADEDRQGEPFVGRAGQLLNEMLFAIGFKREQIFIANILKCRPPNNRDPKPEEAAICTPYLRRQIELVQPKAILSVGRISAQHLLHTDVTVGKLRGRVHTINDPRAIPLVVTYHPAYLLRSPEEKAKSWDDLQLVHSLVR